MMNSFKSIYNFRSLGGHPTQSGHLTTERFFRCDCLLPMDNLDCNALQEIGIATVIDLRNAKEREAIPSGMAKVKGINYYALPFVRENEDIHGPALPASFTLSMLYCVMLESSKQNILSIFETLLEWGAKGQVLFHCTAGKDRTGLVAALLLSLADVADEDIVEDYHQTEQNLAPIMPLLSKASGMEKYPPKVQKIMLDAKAEQMEKTLAYLKETYGGAQEYLQHIGLTSNQCESLRQLMQKGSM